MTTLAKSFVASPLVLRSGDGNIAAVSWLDRERIDPDDAFGASGLRRAERNALRVLDAFDLERVQHRTRDCLEISVPLGEDEDGLGTALVTAEALELRLPKVEWTCGSYGPARCSTLWRRIPWDPKSPPDLPALLEQFREAYRATLETCRHCGRRFLPARMSGPSCHGCAEKHDGVVH